MLPCQNCISKSSSFLIPCEPVTGAPVAANAIRNGCPIFANGETTLSDVTDAVEVLDEGTMAVVLVVDLMLRKEDLVSGERGRLTPVMSISLGTGGNFMAFLFNVDVVAVDVCWIVVVVALLITVGL